MEWKKDGSGSIWRMNKEKLIFVFCSGLLLFVLSMPGTEKERSLEAAAVGSVLLIRGEIDVPLFFLFLLVASRLYAPLEGALQNLAAVISTRTNINRMNEILDQPVQTGTDRVTNKGYDIVFDHVEFEPWRWRLQ